MKSIKELKDRELLELILSNQVAIMQIVNKMKEVVSGIDKDKYSKGYISKYDQIQEFINNAEDLERELNSHSEDES